MRALALVVTIVAGLAAASAASAAPGAIDRGFGTGGVSRPTDASKISVGIASDTAADGSRVIAGAGTSLAVNMDEDDFSFDIRIHPTVYRFHADGSPDTSFGTSGAATVYLQNHLSAATDIALQPDGSMYVVGANVGLLSASTFVARLRADGSLDTAFGGGDGYVTFLPERLNLLVPVSVGVLDDGRVQVVATSFAGDLASLDPDEKSKVRADADVVLMRLTSAGTLDSSYGTAGMVEYDTTGTSSLDVALTGHVAGSGVTTVGGVTFADTLDRARALVVRFDANGAPSSAFGTNGVGVQPAAAVDVYDIVTALEVRPDGSLDAGVIRVIEDDDEYPTTLVRRLTSNGRLLRWPSGAIGARIPGNVLPRAIVTLADGRTLIGGIGSRWGWEGSDSFVGGVARLHASGRADRSFDRGAASWIGREDDDSYFSAITALDPRPDGTIVASGTFESQAGSVRLLGDASPGVRAPSLRVALGRPALRRCGFSPARPCAINMRRYPRPRFDVIGDSSLPGGQAVYVRHDIGYHWRRHWDWYNEETQLTQLDAGHRGSVRADLDDWWGPGTVHAIRAYVPAGANTTSWLSRPLYVKNVWPHRRGIAIPGSTALVARARACAKASASTGVVGRTTAMACDSVIAARRAGIGTRRAARNILGR